MTVKGLREETISQGLLHEIVAKELQTNVTVPCEVGSQPQGLLLAVC